MAGQRVTGPRNTEFIRGVGTFATPTGDELKRANVASVAAHKRKAELRRNPPEFAFDWRKFADDVS